MQVTRISHHVCCFSRAGTARWRSYPDGSLLSFRPAKRFYDLVGFITGVPRVLLSCLFSFCNV